MSSTNGQDPQRRVTWSADELMAVDFPEPKWAIPGLLAEGLNLLVGNPKAGKSWFALNIGLAVARGSYALGTLPVEGGDVLYLALEDTGRRLQSRLALALGDSAPPMTLTFTTECPTLGSGAAEFVAEWMEKHPTTRLIIIDVFGRIRGIPDHRRAQYDDDYQAMVKIKDIADRWQVCVLVVHHSRKAFSGDFLDLVSGTNGLAGAADNILLLKRTRGGAAGVLHVTGRDVEEAEHALLFRSDTGTWLLPKAIQSTYDMGPTRRKIVQAVLIHGPLTPTEIAIKCDITVDNAKKTTQRMASAGQLDVDKEGRYSCPSL